MNELIDEIDRLRNLAVSVKDEKLVSVHFFSEAFDAVHRVQESLIRLESEQIERLRRDMEERQSRLSELRRPVEKEPEGNMENEKAGNTTCVTIETEIKSEVPVEKVSVPSAPIVSESVSETVQEIVKPSVHIVAEVASSEDVRKLLSLNDRFRFQRELFNGNAEAFNRMLDALNSMSSYSEALQFLFTDMHWKEDDEVVKEFCTLIERRFLR
ncbi:MAG: hypothetical protein PUB21_09370 [Bacteroidales bacterium]|nr:hypothetical protein [Bacteroidales bacterium]